VTSLWLSDAEVLEMCYPLTQPAALCRYLEQEYGLTFKRKPNGRPLVLRSRVEAAMGPPAAPSAPAAAPGAPEASERRRPNETAMLSLVSNRK
jgi:hypothetical protein